MTPHEKLPAWKAHHEAAMRMPISDWERAIVGMFHAWRLYAQTYRHRFQTSVGDDLVLGDAWEAQGVALLALLDGETGARLDCGSLDTAIRTVLESEGRPQ